MPLAQELRNAPTYDDAFVAAYEVTADVAAVDG
jgi:hypothetical protein